MKFSDNITEFRNRNNLTRKQMADTLGISLSTYTNYEAGNRSPNIDMLPKIAAALHVSIDDLLGYKQQPKGIDYWKNYFTNTKISIIVNGDKVTVVYGGENALKAFEFDKTNKCQSVTKAEFSKETFLKFIESIEQSVTSKNKESIVKRLSDYVLDISVKDFFDSLKELEGYHE